ncbi:hypothetical protein FOMPIDRAFT_1123466, partial [Fomitopsis schrenkii]
RQLVRLRDMWCRVTGSQAVDRARGLDFTGLEVAHIFPLAAADPTVRKHRKEAAQRISTRELADHPSNAILLRGDLHRYYDTYQFAVYVSQRPVLQAPLERAQQLYLAGFVCQ